MKQELDDTSWDAMQERLGALFLQSSGWDEFQRASGVLTHRFYGDDWSCLCLEYPTKTGTYWLAPYGPTTTSAASFKEALQILKAAAKQAGVSWLRIEPPKPQPTLQNIEPSAVPAPQHINPEYTVCNDLTEDEQVMRSKLTPNKRNLINRGTNRGLQFETSVEPKDMQIFLDMLKVVEARTGAHSHAPEYFIKQAEILMPRGMLALHIARGPETQPLATTVLHSFAGVISRVYASSYPEARKFEAGVGLDWYTILQAKAAGLKTFDFYGAVSPEAPEDHPWQGFTKYKSEFGGELVQHGGTWDIPLNPLKYKSYKALRSIKKKLR